MKNSLKIVAGILVGATAGAVAGLLLAPESGKKTRKKLANESDKIKGLVKDTVDEKIKEAQSTYKNIEERFISNGKEVAENVKSKA